MLLSSKDSILLIVDAQEKLLPAIHQRDNVTSRMRWLAEIALQLDIPVLITEQYPKGLGYTVSALQEIIESARVVEKTHFSAMQEQSFRDVLSDYDKKQVVIMGMETHVCVLQTAIEMKQEGYQVFLPSDCVGSRRPNDKDSAITRMRDNNVEIITSEMAAFEWLHKSGTDTFRHISRNWLK
ncbi:MAG: hydrolase [Idiomarinaceae bacterium]|jgi:nicotinamidase-related amidase|nr:hydrolase [Idiomarinaceae bacterium]HAD48794.1 hydrolase [Idiomarina sp.]